ncbi:hypothetical protein FAES_2219 [Fibrella aestuarina BUZ 2]|uniref:DUF5666 domain-containing protein n=1 Tax=Fibrella aestuarina BUZ 2 TaxID=1166018 RepID=I0K7X5_9BACT|nr:hypothetical protein [Fibrella aestuarina]CCH00228.1 hypothetical protein FAES_2219 [Fibrella aestuarina BUZ 2]
MQTNQIALYTALLIGTCMTSITHAQSPAASPAPPSQLAGGGPTPPRPGGGHPIQPQAIMSLTTLSGTVGQLTANEDGILNGFTLNTNATPQPVRFSTHLGQQVEAAIKAGSRVTVMGYNKVSPQGETLFQLVKLDAGKTQLVDAPPAIPQPPTTPSRQTISGKVTDFQLDREGRANGLVLTDGTVVKMPPHVAGQLTTLAPKGSTVTVDGYAQPLGDGQVQLQKHTIVRASVLTVGGQSYLIQ